MLERGLKTSTATVVWATYVIFSARSKWFLVWCDSWPWTTPGYITMTRRQSNNQCSCGIVSYLTPKNSECKKRKSWKFLASIFWDQDGTLFIDYLRKGQTFEIFTARSKWFPVWRDSWPWTTPGYITVTRRQSNNQCSCGIASHLTPKNSECKGNLKNSRLDFLGSRRHLLQWLSSIGTNYQRGVLLISVVSIEGHSEGKTQPEAHQGVIVLARQCPGSLATWNPEETVLPMLPIPWSPTLFYASRPVGLPLVPSTEIKIESSPLSFRRSGHGRRGDLVGLSNFYFFLMACKSYSNGLRSVLSLVGSMLNKSQVWLL